MNNFCEERRPELVSTLGSRFLNVRGGTPTRGSIKGARPGASRDGVRRRRRLKADGITVGGAGGVVGRATPLPGRDEHRVGQRGQVSVHVGALLGAAAAHDDRDGRRLRLRLVLVPEVQALADQGPLVLAPRLLQAAVHDGN